MRLGTQCFSSGKGYTDTVFETKIHFFRSCYQALNFTPRKVSRCRKLEAGRSYCDNMGNTFSSLAVNRIPPEEITKTIWLSNCSGLLKFCSRILLLERLFFGQEFMLTSYCILTLCTKIHASLFRADTQSSSFCGEFVTVSSRFLEFDSEEIQDAQKGWPDPFLIPDPVLALSRDPIAFRGFPSSFFSRISFDLFFHLNFNFGLGAFFYVSSSEFWSLNILGFTIPSKEPFFAFGNLP